MNAGILIFFCAIVAATCGGTNFPAENHGIHHSSDRLFGIIQHLLPKCNPIEWTRRMIRVKALELQLAICDARGGLLPDEDEEESAGSTTSVPINEDEAAPSTTEHQNDADEDLGNEEPAPTTTEINVNQGSENFPSSTTQVA